MDKSESELLEDWDVVSSVYDTEQENVTESKGDHQTGSSIPSDDDDDDESTSEITVKSSNANNKQITHIHTETADNYNTEQAVKDISVSEEINKDYSKETTQTDIASEQLITTDNMEGSVDTSDIEHISEVDDTEETKVSDVMEENSAADIDSTEETISGVVEQIAADDIIEETAVNGVMKQISAVGAVSAEINTANTYYENNDEIMGDYVTNTQEAIVEKIDSEIKNSYASDKKNDDEAVSDANVQYSSIDNIDDPILNSSLDSSMEHIQIEHCEGSLVQDVPKLIPDLGEQDNAAIESSSSDIDIIDENMEESITSSFSHPLSLSISSSVDTSSILKTPSEGDKEAKAEIRTRYISAPEEIKAHISKLPSYTKTSEPYYKSESFQKSKFKDEDVRSEPQRRPHPQNASCRIFEFLRNMTRFEWSFLGGVMLCLYITIVFNQTNIFAVIEKEDVVSQMRNMIDDLKYDNKILKDQMLSEMKNEKVFSTFEYQIKELKRENSKLNHMLYDVAKVLEEQKDTQKRFEKREADYIAPFKKEINKLKEHINILKFDNEELQKQLVRMRYASYSQGGRDTEDHNTKEQKSETKADETATTEEIPLDINSLKKWNELISLLSKELGLSENDPLMGEKSHSEAKSIRWNWKVFLQEFKGTFKDFKANVTSVISNYKKANEKAVSEIYKYVKDFFTVKEDNQKFAPHTEEGSQWKNIGDFVKDLREKWTKIKDRIYTSDIKDFVRSFKNSEEGDIYQGDHKSEKMKSTTFDYHEQKPVDDHFKSDRKYDKATEQSNTEDSKWMFKRAELRAELRDSTKQDSSVNWYLKRKKHTSESDEEVKF